MPQRLRPLLVVALASVTMAALIAPAMSSPEPARAIPPADAGPEPPDLPEPVRMVEFELHPPVPPDDLAGPQAPGEWPSWFVTATPPVDLPCVGDGQSGPRVQFWYAHVAGQPNRLAQARPWLVGQIKRANGQLVASAAQVGGFRALRAVTDAACEPVIGAVTVPATALPTLGGTIAAMQAAGVATSRDRVHVVLLDALGFSGAICGRGQMWLDEHPDPAVNANNVNGSWARIDVDCWYAGGILHEIFHTLGAVQLGAPNADNMHCTDEGDLMCLAGPSTRRVCTGPLAEERLDCGKNDYFHPYPPPGNYLRTHWNTANSKYLHAETAARIAGANRYATAALVSATYPSGVPVAYVAAGTAYADALSGAALAGRTHGPVLLTLPGSLPDEVAAELTRLRPARIVVLGGESSVGPEVADQLRAYATADTEDAVTRLAGPDRYGTSAAVAATYPAGVPVVYVATGQDFPDARAGAAVAGRDDAPVLLTRSGTLPDSVRQELARLRPARIVVLGGTVSVSAQVEAELEAYATGTGADRVSRVSGENRYAVAAALAATYPPGGPEVIVASGADFPDALAGAALAGKMGAPVLLTTPGSVPDATGTALGRLDPAGVMVLGGRGTVSDAVAGMLPILVQ